MVIKSDFGIYKVLEKHLKGADKPLTCVDLYEKSDVKKFAPDANKVSDYLGHMWRRGLLQRYFAPRTSTSYARYAYSWKQMDGHDNDTAPLPAPAPARATTKGVPHVEVDESDGSVTINLQDFVITVRSKRAE